MNSHENYLLVKIFLYSMAIATVVLGFTLITNQIQKMSSFMSMAKALDIEKNIHYIVEKRESFASFSFFI